MFRLMFNNFRSNQYTKKTLFLLIWFPFCLFTNFTSVRSFSQAIPLIMLIYCMYIYLLFPNRLSKGIFFVPIDKDGQLHILRFGIRFKIIFSMLLNTILVIIGITLNQGNFFYWTYEVLTLFLMILHCSITSIGFRIPNGKNDQRIQNTVTKNYRPDDERVLSTILLMGIAFLTMLIRFFTFHNVIAIVMYGIILAILWGFSIYYFIKYYRGLLNLATTYEAIYTPVTRRLIGR